MLSNKGDRIGVDYLLEGGLKRDESGIKDIRRAVKVRKVARHQLHDLRSDESARKLDGDTYALKAGAASVMFFADP